MDEIETTKRTPRRKRVTLWALFGTAGLIMGAAYATGFASTNNTASDVTTGAATPVFGQAAVASKSLYASTVTAPNPLVFTFDGLYATMPITNMFQVDLTGNDPYGHAFVAGNTYYADVFLTNFAAMVSPNQWDNLDLQFKEVDCTAGFTDWTGATLAQMNVDRVDAHVTFPGLAGAKKYCIGVDVATATSEAAVAQAAAGGNVVGTFVTRPDPTVVPVAPNFTATVNRSA